MGRGGTKNFLWNSSDQREQGFDHTLDRNDLRRVIQKSH